jgi:hypothetical protein
MDFVSAFMQQVGALKHPGLEELLGSAVHICSQNDEMLGCRLLRILRLSSSIAPVSLNTSPEPLDCALRIFAYVSDTYECSELFTRDQMNAFIEEISAAIATSLVTKLT